MHQNKINYKLPNYNILNAQQMNQNILNVTNFQMFQLPTFKLCLKKNENISKKNNPTLISYEK